MKLFEQFSARLSQKIVFWSFVSIVVIEAIILIPSVYRREQELLRGLEEISQAKLFALAQVLEAKDSDRERFNQIKRLENSPDIAGIALYTFNGQLIGEVGETPEITYSDIKSTNNLPIRHKKNARYEVAQKLAWGETDYILVIRHNASSVIEEFYAFIWRILGLVVIISIFVTGVMMIVLERILIAPILQLHSDLIRAGKAIRLDKDLPEFESIRLQNNDELGEVIAACGQQFEKIHQAIAERKAAEDALRQSEAKEREKSHQLQQALQDLQHRELQLIHSEKMSSLGQLIAGISHEINNPVSFIYGNLPHTVSYIEELLQLLKQYQALLPNSPPEIRAIDVDFMVTDLLKILSSMETGTKRIQAIVKSLQQFSHFNEAGVKTVDIHEEIDNTLSILQHRLNRSKIQIIKEYGNLPNVECEPGDINQVLMNILTNAIDSLEEKVQIDGYAIEESAKQSFRELQKISPSTITIRTEIPQSDWIAIRIADNGLGMDEATRVKVFDPFFTTKEVGKGTGLGLWTSYQIIVNNHQGQLECSSVLGEGTEFVIQFPKFHQHGQQKEF